MPIAVTLFLLSGLVYAGTYLYVGQLTDQAVVEKENLDKQEKAFNSNLLIELQQLDTRLSVSKGLLKDHVTIRPLLDFLSRETIRGLRYSSFSYQASSDAKPADIHFAGEARDYDAIALQSDVFAQAKPTVTSFLFSDLSLNRGGGVNFSLNMTVDPELFSYENSLSSAQ